MNQLPIPWSILSSSVHAGIGTDGWNLADSPADPDNARTFMLDVTFAARFSLPPVVHIGLTGLDSDQRDSTRVSLKAEQVNESGFQAVVTTWAGTRVYAVEFNWLAIGA